jgi:hypothetical protein
MPLIIITVREELFRQSECWTLQECTIQALRAAGWSEQPWAQKVLRLPAAEFVYHPSRAQVDAEGVNFVLVEVLLLQPRPTPEKEAFWRQFCASMEESLCTIAPDVLLGFVEVPAENAYYSRSAPPR